MHFLEKWWIRRAIYLCAAVITTICAGFGIITETQADSLAQQITPIINMLVTFVFGIAVAKTHKGSDDRATREDVINARASDAGTLVLDVLKQINSVQDTLKNLTPAAVVDQNASAAARVIPAYPGA